MIILTDTTGITVKQQIQDIPHVRLGVHGGLYFFSDSLTSAFIRKLDKPAVEYTVNELHDLLVEMETKFFNQAHSDYLDEMGYSNVGGY